MTAVRVQCDECKVETENWIDDYDGIHLCQRCGIKKQLDEAKSDRRQVQQSLERLKCRDLADLNKHIALLEEKLETLTDTSP